MRGWMTDHQVRMKLYVHFLGGYSYLVLWVTQDRSLLEKLYGTWKSDPQMINFLIC